jgi:membrane-associated protease RseP (regulator of RpoE activity)
MTRAALVLLAVAALGAADGVVDRDYEPRPMLGIVMQVPEARLLVRAEAWDGDGVQVVGLVDGTMSASAGIRCGDLIRRVDGRPSRTMTELRETVQRLEPGQVVTVELLRATRPIALSATLSVWPDDCPFDAIEARSEAAWRDYARWRAQKRLHQMDPERWPAPASAAATR